MDWYRVVNERTLEQCDLLPAVPVPVLSGLPAPAELESWTDPGISPSFVDLMVLSQSCDLVDGDINGVLLARFQSWSSILKSRLDSGETTGKSHKQSLRKNRISGQIVIPPSSEILDHEWSVIDFHSLYTLPLPYLEEFAASLTRRLRVEAPYRQGIVGAFSGWLGRPEYLDELADFDDIA